MINITTNITKVKSTYESMICYDNLYPRTSTIFQKIAMDEVGLMPPNITELGTYQNIKFQREQTCHPKRFVQRIHTSIKRIHTQQKILYLHSNIFRTVVLISLFSHK